MREKLSSLLSQRDQLEQEKQEILNRRSTWELARSQVDSIQDWCASVAQNVAALTYEEKRLALTALGIQVRIWPSGYSPRYEITTRIPLGDSPFESSSSR